MKMSRARHCKYNEAENLNIIIENYSYQFKQRFSRFFELFISNLVMILECLIKNLCYEFTLYTLGEIWAYPKNISLKNK